MSATSKQIGYIHSLASKAGMDEDTRRDFLQRETGARSSKELTTRQAADVIDKLKTLTDGAPANGAVAGLDSPAAKKLRALWIAAYDLGLLRQRSDRAMLAFLERQTGVSHTRFLNEPGQATAAIEALKSWLKRDGKVAWPVREPWKKDGKADFNEIAASKRAVINAQWMRLIEIGEVVPFRADQPLAELDRYAFKVDWKQGWEFFEHADYDHVQNALGRKLRAALMKAAQQ